MSNSLLYLDSFSHYASSDALMKWLSGSMVIQPGTGRIPGSSSAIGFDGAFVRRSFPGGSTYTTLAIGAAYKTEAFANAIFALFQSASVGNWAVGVQHVGDGSLQLISGAFWGRPDEVSMPSSFVLHTGIWYYIELTLYQLAGSYFAFLYINGQLVCNTVMAYTSPIAQFTLNAPGGGYSANYCDLYVTGGGLLDSPLRWGDTAVGLQRPVSDGHDLGWTPSTPGPHYAMVEDITPDYLTTTLTDNGSGSKDVHNLSPVPTNATIMGVQGVVCASKDSAGPAEFDMVFSESGTDYPSSFAFAPSVGQFLYYLDPLLLSPVTGLAWTPAELNAMQFGVLRD
jgi:hypothetical protein